MADSSPIDLREELRVMSTYAVHYGNCSYGSWNRTLTKCDCKLFDRLKALEKAGILTPAERGSVVDEKNQ